MLVDRIGHRIWTLTCDTADKITGQPKLPLELLVSVEPRLRQALTKRKIEWEVVDLTLRVAYEIGRHEAECTLIDPIFAVFMDNPEVELKYRVLTKNARNKIKGIGPSLTRPDVAKIASCAYEMGYRRIKFEAPEVVAKSATKI